MGLPKSNGTDSIRRFGSKLGQRSIIEKNWRVNVKTGKFGKTMDRSREKSVGGTTINEMKWSERTRCAEWREWDLWPEISERFLQKWMNLRWRRFNAITTLFFGDNRIIDYMGCDLGSLSWFVCRCKFLYEAWTKTTRATPEERSVWDSFTSLWGDSQALSFMNVTAAIL